MTDMSERRSGAKPSDALVLFGVTGDLARKMILPAARLAVEAGVSQGWERYVGPHGDIIGMDRFGASAPGAVLLEKFGFTVDAVCVRARSLLSRSR